MAVFSGRFLQYEAYSTKLSAPNCLRLQFKLKPFIVRSAALCGWCGWLVRGVVVASVPGSWLVRGVEVASGAWCVVGPRRCGCECTRQLGVVLNKCSALRLGAESDCECSDSLSASGWPDDEDWHAMDDGKGWLAGRVDKGELRPRFT